MTVQRITWQGGLLGAIEGFIFGGMCEVANRIYFEYRLRELQRIADAGGPIMDMSYLLRWWMLPCFFAILFAIVSYFIHRVRAKSSVSLLRLWLEIGFTAVSACFIPAYLYEWLDESQLTSETIAAGFVLLGFVVVLSQIFVGLLKIAGSYQLYVRRGPLP
jgi:hypothetical protein